MEQIQDFEGSHYQKLDIYSPLVFEEEILFQGRLSKFQAGFNFSFVPKWVVVTKSALRYYKNQEMALTNANKPLVVIPYQAIKSVKKIQSSPLMSKPQLKKYAEYLDNQFEIYLKDDFLSLYLRPSYEQLMRPGADLSICLSSRQNSSNLQQSQD